MSKKNTAAAREESWLKVAGAEDEGLEKELSRSVREKIKAGDYSEHNIKYIEKVKLTLTDGSLQVSDKTLEKLRRLCQIWDVDIRVKEISSHRKIIGPVIVAAKKLVYPALRVFLRDFIRQQRSFNAGVVSLLAELSNEKKDTKKK